MGLVPAWSKKGAGGGGGVERRCAFAHSHDDGRVGAVARGSCRRVVVVLVGFIVEGNTKEGSVTRDNGGGCGC